MTSSPVVSVVIPCLNEADTLAACIEKAQEGLRQCDPHGEVIVADNGSTDASRAIAVGCGARVVEVSERGYGSALIAGIRDARGKWVVMGDADDSYDFREIPRFVAALSAGAQLVQGCRLPAGGGVIEPGAMPFLHRWLGNPVLSTLVRWWFKAPIRDVNCGLRAFDRQLVANLDLQCTGMEFATEMIIKATVYEARISEIPITLHVDGRVHGRRHLRTFRDGWRTLRCFLLFSPRWLFLMPGLLLIAAGTVGYGIVYSQIRLGSIRMDVHSLLVASLAFLAGAQAIAFSVLARTFATIEGLLPPSAHLRGVGVKSYLERGLIVGLAAAIVGLALIGVAVDQWRRVGFGDLDYSRTMRWVIPGVTLVALGIQVTFASFFLSLLTLRRR